MSRFSMTCGNNSRMPNGEKNLSQVTCELKVLGLNFAYNLPETDVLYFRQMF